MNINEGAAKIFHQSCFFSFKSHEVSCDCTIELFYEPEVSQWARSGFEFFEEERQKPIEGMKLGQKIVWEIRFI